MSRKRVAVVVCALGAVAAGNAANLITVWEATGTYILLQDQGRVEITSDGVFKIQATGDHPGGLGDINAITVASNVTGTVEVSILRDPNDNAGLLGAYDVRVLNLSGNATTVIVECWVAHDLAADDNVVTGTLGTTYVGNAIGHDIVIDNLYGDINCISMRSLYENAGARAAPAPSIEVWGDWGYDPSDPQDPYDEIVSLSLNELGTLALMGHVEIQGDLASLYPVGDITGDVHVTGTLHHLRSEGCDLVGLLEVGSLGPCDWWGGCWIEGDLSGSFHVLGDYDGGILGVRNKLSGELRVDGNATTIIAQCANCQDPRTSGRIIVGGEANGAIYIGDPSVPPIVSALTGSIEVGALHGGIYVVGDLGDPNDPSDLTFQGHIVVNGPFEPQAGNPAWIKIRRDIVGATSFVAVDYDATGDDWVYVDDEIGAIVKVEHGDPQNPTIYRGNTPADFVWEISECKGDLNGDWDVGFPDINPFVLALSSPLGYSQYFPGLGCTGDLMTPVAPGERESGSAM
jgi:hypothetical protein